MRRALSIHLFTFFGGNMFQSKTLVGLLSLVVLFHFSLASNAESRGKVAFISSPLLLDGEAHRPYARALRSLLKDEGSKQLQWSVKGSVPSWLTIDIQKEQMSGLPPTTGSWNFELGVMDLQDPESGAIAQVTFTVIPVAVWTQERIDLGKATENKAFQFDLRPYVAYPGREALIFSVEDSATMPKWLTLSTEGLLTGTPKKPDVGPYSGLVFSVKTANSSKDTVQAYGEVLKAIECPKWTANPLAIDDAHEDVLYQKSVSSAQYIYNPDNLVLSFTLETGAPSGWLKLSQTGVFSGTPGKVDVGPLSVVAKVSAMIDRGLCEDRASLTLNVIHTNHCPTWKDTTINLPDALTWKLYSQDLKPFTSDPDSDTLTFKVIRPATSWASVSTDGILTGTPDKPHIGINSWTIETSDGKCAAEAVVKVKVNKANEPPQWLEEPIVLVDAKEDVPYSKDISSKAADPDNDPLTFKLISVPTWLSLDSKGKISGTPGKAHVGANSFIVEVSDGITSPVRAELKINVIHTNHPPYWLEKPVTLSVPEKSPIQSNIGSKVKDPDDSDKLTLSKVSGPDWLILSADGAITGTPQATDLGDHTFNVRADDGNGGTADGVLIVTVTNVNDEPFWVEQPAVLPSGPENKPYQASLGSFAKDIDPGDSLTFSKIGGPGWASVASDGTVTGTPSRPDVGLNTLKVRVTDKVGAFADGIAQITVIKVNQKPRWLQDPVVLSQAIEDAPWSFNVAGLAVDDDGDLLTFHKISGPAWIVVAENGQLSGTPSKTDITSSYTLVIEANDGQAGSPVNAQGTVIEKNYPPVPHQANLVFEVKERETLTANLRDPKYVEDANHDTLTFALLAEVPWLQLSSNGDLFISPAHSHLGTHFFPFRVSDKELSAEAKLEVRVLRNPRPPVWKQNPIEFTATSRIPFTASIAGKAEDLDGIKITYHKVSGPDWLNLSEDGSLSGTPQDAAIGVNTFFVAARNDLVGSDAKVIVTVLQGNKDPYWIADPVVLRDATVGKPYQQSVAAFVVEPDHETVTFSKVAGPQWVDVSTTGELIGTPAASDVGLTTLRIRAQDPQGAYAEAFVQIQVIKPNHAPKWVEDPVTLSVAYTETNYHFDLRNVAVDEDSDPLKFSLVSGPSWMSVSESGIVSGTPAVGDIGNYKARFAVTDGKISVEAGANGQVQRKNQPPLVSDTVISVKEHQTMVVDLVHTSPPYVTDPDGDPLTFTLIDTVPWLSLSWNGLLELKPTHEQVGSEPFKDYSLKFKVTDGFVDVTGNLQIRVFKNPQPPQWLENPVHFVATVDQPFQSTLADKVKDLDGATLSFEKISGPDWLIVDPTGALKGTPAFANLGDNAFVIAAKNEAASSQGSVIIEVRTNEQPPYWTEDPVRLPNAAVGKTYAESLAPYAVDPQGGALTFELLSGPAWAFITTAGRIIGQPTLADFGLNKMTVRAKKKIPTLYADATVEIRVTNGDTHAPQWITDPIPLGEAKIDLPFSFDLTKVAVDADGDRLFFKKVSGPDWVIVDPLGQLRGVPRMADVGEYVLKLEVTDGNASDQADAFGKVVDNFAPHFPAENINYIVIENKVLEDDLNKYVKDPEGEALKFELIGTADWITVAEAGMITLKPKSKDVGDHAYLLKATDVKGASAQGNLYVKVIKDESPTWVENPVRFEGMVYRPFQATLADKVKDPNNKPITFTLQSGPAWLTVSSNGELHGTPPEGSEGENVFMVEASNGAWASVGTVIVLVKPEAPVVDDWVVDQPVAGAQAENLWVIDNTWPWTNENMLLAELAEHVDSYFELLTDAGIDHKGVYLSSDYSRWRYPIKGEDGSYFLSSKDNHVADGFRFRMDRTRTTKSCNSPIWAMFCFYCKVEKEIPEIYSEFFTEGSPMDVLIVSPHQDYYRKYSGGSAQASWTAINFVNNFIGFHKKEKQSYRISAIVPSEPTIIDSFSLQSPKEDNPYRVLTSKTQGVMYPVGQNLEEVEKYLKDYAENVKFRAYVQAKKRLPLSAKPKNPKDIKLSVDGVSIPGNTGVETDIWYYDSATNEIVVRWYLVDMSTLKPGDKLSVEYMASHGQR